LDEKDNRIKNKSSLVSGFLAGLFSIAFFPELFQALVAFVLNFEFSFKISVIFPQVTVSSFKPDDIFINTIVRLVPLIYLMLVCELGAFSLRFTLPGFYRYSLLMFILVNMGYMLFFLFLNAIVVILNLKLLTDWSSLLILLNVDHLGSLIYLFPLIIIVAVYLNFITKRILKYVNV